MIEKFFELSKLVSNKQTIIEKLVKRFCCCKFFARIGKIPLSIVRCVTKIIFSYQSLDNIRLAVMENKGKHEYLFVFYE